MTALAEQVDFVVGVDTHKNSHMAAVVTAMGAYRITSPSPRMPSATSVSSASPATGTWSTGLGS